MRSRAATSGSDRVVVDQREVELAGLQPREQPLQVVVDDGQRHLGMAAPEARERRRHERRERGREAAEAQPRRAGGRRSPRAPARRRRAARRSRSRAGSARGRPRSARPGRVPRSTSGSPTSRSSAATCWLTADCVSVSASAAAENDPRARPRTAPAGGAHPASVRLIDVRDRDCNYAALGRSRPPRATQPCRIDAAKLEQFVFRAVDEVGATLNAALVVMGDRLGLYRALAGRRRAHPRPSSRRATGTAERYVREWLNAQAAGGYVELRRRRPLQPAARAGRRAHRRGQPGLPARVLPDRARLRAGLAADHRGRPHAAPASAGTSTTPTSTTGCERFFRPGYNANLVGSWLPALDGVVERLRARRRASPTSAAATAPRRC